MSITAEMIKEFADKPAVFSVKVPAGTEICAEHIEHPMFLDDMVSSNLFVLKEALTIGQVIGVKTAKDCDALSPVTEEAVGGAVKREEKAEAAELKEEKEHVSTSFTLQDGSTVMISIKEGKDIYLELPL